MKRFLSIALALLMTLSAVMLTACGSKEPTKFDSGEDHLKYVANKEVKKVSENALQNYTGTAERTEKDDKKLEVTAKVLFQPALMQMISQLAGQFGGKLSLDLSFLKSLTLKGVLNGKGSLFGLGGGVLLNDKELASGDVYFDTEAGKGALRVPLVSESWLEVTEDMFKEALDKIGQLGKSAASLPVSLSAFGGSSVVLPDKATLQTLIDRYVGVVLDSIKNVTEGEEERAIGSISEKLVTVKFTLDPSTLLSIAKNVLTTVKSDADVKKLVEDAASKINLSEKEVGETDFYGEFTKSVDSLIEKIDKIDAEQQKKIPTFDVTVGTDKENVIKATKISGSAGEKGTFDLFCGSYEKDDKYAFELTAGLKKDENSEQNVSLTADGTLKNGKLNADYVVKYNGEKTVSVKVEDLDKEALKEGRFLGSVSLNLGEVVSLLRKCGVNNENMGMIAMVLGALSLKLEGSGSEGNRALRLSIGGANGELIAVECTAKTGAADNIDTSVEKTPIGDVEPDMQAILSKLTANLKDAGVPEDLLASLPGILSMFGGMNGGGFIDEDE